jgi:Na+/H+-dicarboxylate symporter
MESSLLRSYGFSILLVVSMVAGALLGIYFKADAVVFKPFGDVFLNLLFTAIVPLVFFSISSAVAGMADIKRLGSIIVWMLVVFVATGIVASAVMVIGVQLYPPAAGVKIDFDLPANVGRFNAAQQIVRAFAAPDFADILSKKNMLALIIFAVLVGLGTSGAGERGKTFSGFLSSANGVMMKVIAYIMYYAPVGLGAYFAYLVGAFGPQLMGSYGRAAALYYPVSIAYFFIAFTFYVYLAGGRWGVKTFWVNIIPPAVTAMATGSSVAAIPSNLTAADRTGVPRDISDMVIPVGATIHMEGSCLAAILKIAFLFGIFGMDFSGVQTLTTAVLVALLTGTVVCGIPGGGVIGEILILSFYGFPMEAFPVITMIGTLVDAPATMVNAVGDNVSSMLVARILGGKRWMRPDCPGEGPICPAS